MRNVTFAPEALNDLAGIKEDIVVRYGSKIADRINYIFYRIEEKSVRVIRVLNEKRDFLYVFFGIRMSSEESEDYWGGE